ncbi:hypothetical protein FRC14_008325 [Serendipita sp. 396]|nr:hypothetical protein FRC14_008325 [Serendipita sp. 396]KAG8769999.1 hypothetical protein FRC15_004284 [Serendipita sp. 397]KAG8791871.1 hypothetical protein FRC16_000243 [Serendipita sp. 398]KAG8855884.1 hypothetical protein FRC20_000677 [Serendipita sp. 405]
MSIQFFPLVFNAILEVPISGIRPSYPHAHLAEDEFVIILTGKGSYQCTGEELGRAIETGNYNRWKDGTWLSHALANDGNRPHEAESPELIKFLSLVPSRH